MARRTVELKPSLAKEKLRKETKRLTGAVNHINRKIEIKGGGLDAHREE